MNSKTIERTELPGGKRALRSVRGFGLDRQTPKQKRQLVVFATPTDRRDVITVSEPSVIWTVQFLRRRMNIMEKHGSQTPLRETARETRQGPLGRPMLKVLIGGLVLASVAWGAAEMFGEISDNNAGMSDQKSPTVGQNNQATPPAAEQPTTNVPAQTPTPQSGTGGNTQAKPPSSTPQ